MPTATSACTRSRPTSTAYVKQGTSNDTIGTAQDISGSSYLLGSGGADRLGVVGSLPADVVSVGDVYVSSRYYGDYFSAPTISDILRVNRAGQIVQVIPVSCDPYLSLSGVELDPANNMLYAAVTTSFNGYGGPARLGDGELLEFNPITGQQVATIPLPADNANYGWYYPYGFSIASDGTSGSRSRIARTSSTWIRATTRSPATRRRASCPRAHRSALTATCTSPA